MPPDHANTPPLPRRTSWLYALLIVPFLVYLHGLAPSVVPGDTGDFQTSGWIWGVSHQPGYPLYTIMVGIVERIPLPPIWLSTTEFSAPAWRANLLSSLIALAALAVMFALVRRLTGRLSAALIASGALAFSRVFWWHSEMAENDALTALFLLSMLHLSVKWVQDRNPRDPYQLALVIGLALSHHQSLLLFAPAILIYLTVADALAFRPRQWAAFALLFILGLTPFAYLPLAQYRTPDGPLHFVTGQQYAERFAQGSPPAGQDRYTTTPPMKYFLRYISRTVYNQARRYTNTDEVLGTDKTTTGDVLGFYVGTALNDFSIIFVLIGLIGLVGGARASQSGQGREGGIAGPNRAKSRGGWILLLIAYATYFAVVNFVPSGDILHAPLYNLTTAGPGLMLPMEVLWAAFVGLGLGALETGLREGRPSTRWIQAALLVVAILTVGWNYLHNKPYSDKSHDTLIHEYCLNALDSCPPNVSLVVAGDEIYPFWYMRYVFSDPSTGQAGYRRDVKVVGWAGRVESFAELADMGGAMASALVRVSAEAPDAEIDTTFFNSRFLETPQLASYTLARRGVLFAFVPQDKLAGLQKTADQLAQKQRVAMYEPGVPDRYRWDYWGGNGIRSNPPLPAHGAWLWPPDADIQWRIGEMLLFYGADALLKGDPASAAGYFRQWVMVEPDNRQARDYLAETAR
jgi:hypothetical protein